VVSDFMPERFQFTERNLIVPAIESYHSEILKNLLSSSDNVQ